MGVNKPCCVGSTTATLLLRNEPLSDVTLQYVISLVPKGFSAVTVACGMLGTGQTVVTSVPMLIVGGTVVVKNRSETGEERRREEERRERQRREA